MRLIERRSTSFFFVLLRVESCSSCDSRVSLGWCRVGLRSRPPSTLLPRLFHSHLHFYIYLEGNGALPRPRLSSADRALPLADSIKILPRFPCPRSNIARKLLESDFERKTNDETRSIEKPVFIFHSALFIPRSGGGRWGFVRRMENLKNFENWVRAPRKRILIGWRKNGMERSGHPLARYFNSYYSWKRCGCAYRCQYTRGGLCTRRRSIIDGTKSWNLFTV